MSFLNFKGCKITVVTTATDLRAGYFRLEAFARSTLNIDICSGHHCVVFFLSLIPKPPYFHNYYLKIKGKSLLTFFGYM